ncbi:MAG: 30S ribosomal protein S4 [Clostridia bacterium]
MAKYTGPSCRQCRREGKKLMLKGERCLSAKCALEKRPTPPGQHGESRKKASSYAVQLREKQRCKRIYGLCEKQFKGYFTKAEIMRGVSGENMLVLLERRLDNVVYRMTLASSRMQARQIVNHALITVNGKCVNIPSYLIKKGDIIAVKETKLEKPYFTEIKAGKAHGIPTWLEFDNATLTGKIVELPQRADVDQDIEEHLIVELYSK